MSRSPFPEKYASAFSPPLVNCRTLRRRFSEGNSTGEGLFAGLWPAEKTAADRLTRSARGNSIFVLINFKGESAHGAKRKTSTMRPYCNLHPSHCQADARRYRQARGADPLFCGPTKKIAAASEWALLAPRRDGTQATGS